MIHSPANQNKGKFRVKICCVRRDSFFNCGNVLVTNYVPLQAVAGYVLYSYLACGQAVGFVPKS